MARIMLLEDEQYLRRLYMDELVGEGHQIIPVSRGSEALRILVQMPIDLVIIDLIIPDGDGLDYLQKMLALCPGLKVVINTAYPEFKRDFRCWCAEKFVIKSSDLTELKKSITTLLEEPFGHVRTKKSMPCARVDKTDHRAFESAVANGY